MSFSSAALPSDLTAAIKLAYEPCGLVSKHFEKEAESEAYGAFTFELNGLRVKFRTGKITPTKTGLFVTLWKRIGQGEILPHDLDDAVDLFVISVRKGEVFGQFVFPKRVLFEKGVLSKEGKGGKRALRLYPPFSDLGDKPESSQAKKTQSWQLPYFLEISAVGGVDRNRAQKLFQP